MKAGEILDDRVIIPDNIKNMSREELEKSIKKMEEEIKQKKHTK